MIKHVVMFKFFDEADGRSKVENLKISAEMLESLPQKISSIISFSVGINQLVSPRALDLCIVSEFQTWTALEEYASHSAHLEVVDFLKKVREFSHSCDYEI
jgi:hypothetical protein